MSSTRPGRLATGLLAGALLLGPLSACSLTSHNASCSGRSCSVTLSGKGAEADILGTKVTFAGVENGRATLGLGSASVSCAQGESVGAGRLTLACTKVSDGEVELTASLG